uniref:Uncharacterized protein n=1 Tax=Nonomuraea gerenzanensis TaxID=93944 RepID=A0A1M4E942_9ACTN|nr:hypothetical protein BN4615_P4689 [Nonomuraea gerenzanensis]
MTAIGGRPIRAPAPGPPAAQDVLLRTYRSGRTAQDVLLRTRRIAS